eukprot:469641-Prymnesium_polylepis.1
MGWVFPAHRTGVVAPFRGDGTACLRVMTVPFKGRIGVTCVMLDQPNTERTASLTHLNARCH